MSKVVGYVGMMTSGKSAFLIDAYEQALMAHKRIHIINDTIDSRVGRVIHQTGYDTQDLAKYDVIMIDELQFEDVDFLDKVIKNTSPTATIMWAGLDFDYKGEPFGTTKRAMELSDILNLVSVKCEVNGCDNLATQYLTKNGGGIDKANYSVVCDHHYEKGGKLE